MSQTLDTIAIDLRAAAQMALDVQTACNLSGVARSFADVMSQLRAAGLDTPTANRHPIARLFAEQISHLTGAGIGDLDSYSQAYAACEQLARSYLAGLADDAPYRQLLADVDRIGGVR